MPLCRPCSLLVLDCEISHEFLSFSRFLYQLHLSAVKLLQGWISAAASLVSERAAWHWAFPADIGENCLSWSPQCWNPCKSCLFLQQWTDKSRAHLTTGTHTWGTAQDKQSIRSRCNTHRCNKNFWQWLMKFYSFYYGSCMKNWKIIINFCHFHLSTSIHWLILFVVIVSSHIITQILFSWVNKFLVICVVCISTAPQSWRKYEKMINSKKLKLAEMNACSANQLSSTHSPAPSGIPGNLWNPAPDSLIFWGKFGVEAELFFFFSPGYLDVYTQIL